MEERGSQSTSRLTSGLKLQAAGRGAEDWAGSDDPEARRPWRVQTAEDGETRGTGPERGGPPAQPADSRRGQGAQPLPWRGPASRPSSPAPPRGHVAGGGAPDPPSLSAGGGGAAPGRRPPCLLETRKQRPGEAEVTRYQRWACFPGFGFPAAPIVGPAQLSLQRLEHSLARTARGDPGAAGTPGRPAGVTVGTGSWAGNTLL